MGLRNYTALLNDKPEFRVSAAGTYLTEYTFKYIINLILIVSTTLVKRWFCFHIKKKGLLLSEVGHSDKVLKYTKKP